MTARTLLAALLLTLPGALHAGAVSTGAAELDYGYFCALQPVDQGPAADTISGTVNFVEGRPDFLRRGSLVPAQMGLGFGVHVRPLPDYDGLVTVEVTHPPMGPQGVTHQTWVTELDSTELEYLGYSFDEDYELVEGVWTMKAQSEGRTIYEVAFTVVDADVLPPVTCEMVPMS
ncbi:DUF3859 domain-containing protein [Pseudoruegeria sp. HB172150]|uniref:DUF3859 domain-containing protein n=1 Tax=Pseudoruegeria sp. HB172150 TaxID=2721164 RepID=UPI001552E9A9|nr:DUF3859 domain-containing protein [Pseudoruegeria sp. HB172150]